MDSVLEKLNGIGYKRIIWMGAVTETLHNIEEAVWLPGNSITIGGLHYSVGVFEFRFAVILLTLLIYGLIYYFTVRDTKAAHFIMGGVLAGILVNVFLPHLAVSIVTCGYTAGVITGLLLNVPAMSYLLWRGIKEKYFTVQMLIVAGLAFQAVAFVLIQGLFFLGRIIG